MHPFFLKANTTGVTLILIDNEFIIKFEQDMLQGKAIMTISKKKKR